MNKEQIEAAVQKIFTDQFGDEALERLADRPAPFKPIGEASRFANDLDSLDHVEFVMALEDEFEIEIDDASGSNIATLEDAVEAISTRLNCPVESNR